MPIASSEKLSYAFLMLKPVLTAISVPARAGVLHRVKPCGGCGRQLDDPDHQYCPRCYMALANGAAAKNRGCRWAFWGLVRQVGAARKLKKAA